MTSIRPNSSPARLGRLPATAIAAALLLDPFSTAISQVHLDISSSGNASVILSWPAGDPGDTLEYAGSLDTPSAWQPFPGSPLTQNGRLSLAVPVSESPRFFRLRLGSVPLTTIATTSPATQETGVSTMRETVFRLSSPLAAQVTPGPNTLYAIAGGRRLLSRAELSTDRQVLTLFYLETLPGSSRVSVVLDSAGMMDSLGRELDADGDGQAGGVGTVSFETMSLMPLPTTAVTGHVYASEPNPDGSNRPLQNVIVTVDGAEETMRATTDSTGAFTLSPVPSGRFFVHVDGRTANGSQWPNGGYYPFVGKAWEAIPGKTNNLASGTGEIFLPFIPANALQTISPVQETVVEFPPEVVAANPELAGVEVHVPPNALFSDNGTRGGRLGLAPVSPNRLPEPLPPGLNFPIVITVQTDGPQNFDGPIPVRFPNLPDPVTGELAPPGAKTLLWSFNHDTGRWEPQGTMTISADGLFAVSDPGVGLRQPGWHGAAGGSGGRGPMGGGSRRGGSGGSSGGGSGGGGGCEGDDCDCTQEITCVTPHEGRHYAICALKCLGDVVDQLFDDEQTTRSPIDAGIRCIGGPDRCPGRPDDVLTKEQKDCMDACRFPDSEFKAYVMPCEGFINPCTSAIPSDTLVRQGGGLDTPPLTDRLAEQEFLWQAQADFLVALTGTPRITQMTYEELPVIHAFFDAFGAATTPGTPSDVHLSADERASLIVLPRPSQFSLAEWTAMIDRLDSLQGGAYPPDVQSALDKVDATVTLLKARGWVYRMDGLLHGHARLSWARAPELGTAAFPARAHYYRLKNHRTGFVQRGRLNANGQFEGLILSPTGYYSVLYLDPVGLRTGGAFFWSRAAGLQSDIPTAPLDPLPAGEADTDGDGLPDFAEEIVGTSPSLADTDGDGINDTAELQNDTNPNDGTPALIGVLATTDTPGQALGICAGFDHVFVADGLAGLAVLRLNGEDAPTLVASLPLGRSATAIAGNSERVALATGTAVSVVDVSTPTSPRLLYSTDVGATVRSLSLQGDWIAAATDSAFVALDARSGIVEQRFTEFGTGLLDVQIHGSRMVGLSATDLFLFDRVDGAWTFVSRVPGFTQPSSADYGHRLLVQRGFLRVGITRGAATGIRTVDISEPANPRDITVSGPALPAVTDLAETGSGMVAAVTSTGGTASLQVSLFDLLDTNAPPKFVAAFPTPGDVRQTVLCGGLLLAADSEVGVTVLNILQADRGTNAPQTQVRLITDNALNAGEFGSLADVQCDATDDVGVRSVELEMDGRIVAAASVVPLRTSVRLPGTNSGLSSVTFRSRATDLAGNRTWSSPLVVSLRQDATVPRIVELSPRPNAVVTAACDSSVGIRFAEAVATTVNQDTLQVFRAGVDALLGTADDVRVDGIVAYLNPEHQILFTASAGLGTGPFRAVLAAGIGDAAGNNRAQRVQWDFLDSPLARAVQLPPADAFALDAPLTFITVGLDRPLCDAAIAGLAWKWTRLASGPDPEADLTPLQIDVEPGGSVFRITPPEPLGTGQYRISLSGAGIQSLNYTFRYRTTPNEVINVSNGNAVWKYSGGLLNGDAALVDYPDATAGIVPPASGLEFIHARTDIRLPNYTFVVRNPIECDALLVLAGATLKTGSTEARGPVDLSGVNLDSHTLNLRGGGLLRGGVKFVSPDAAIVNHPGSILSVTNGFQDVNAVSNYGSIVNLGALRCQSVTNLGSVPVQLATPRLRNSGQITLLEGSLYLANLENDGTVQTEPGTSLTLAQRLRATSASRIEGGGDVVFGDYNTSSLRVVRSADADIQGDLTVTGKVTLAAGIVRLHKPFTHTNALELQHASTLQCYSQAELATAVLSDGTLRFNGPATLGSLEVQNASAIASSQSVDVTGPATIAQGLSALGTGTVIFHGDTVMTNYTQSTGLSFEDAVVRNLGTWRLSAGGSVGASFSLRRINNRPGLGYFENRGVFERTTTRSFSVQVPLVNYGTITFQGGTVAFDARTNLASPAAGRFQPMPGSTLVLNGTTVSFSNAGSPDLAAGTLTGYGTLQATGSSGGTNFVITNRGLIRLSEAYWDLTLNASGGFTQTASGGLHVTLHTAGTPRLLLTGSGPHQLDGTLRLDFGAEVTPELGQSFVILTHNSGSRNGTFANVVLPEPGPGLKLELQYGTSDIRAVVVSQ